MGLVILIEGSSGSGLSQELWFNTKLSARVLMNVWTPRNIRGCKNVMLIMVFPTLKSFKEVFPTVDDRDPFGKDIFLKQYVPKIWVVEI